MDVAARDEGLEVGHRGADVGMVRLEQRLKRRGLVAAERQEAQLHAVLGGVVLGEGDLGHQPRRRDVELLEGELLGLQRGQLLDVGDDGESAPLLVRSRGRADAAVAAGAVAELGDPRLLVERGELQRVVRRRDRARARTGDEHRLGPEEVPQRPLHHRRHVRRAAVTDGDLVRRVVLAGRRLVASRRDCRGARHRCSTARTRRSSRRTGCRGGRTRRCRRSAPGRARRD